MGTNCNFSNMSTVVYVVVARSPILKGAQTDRMNLVPCTVFMNNVEKGFETIRLFTGWTCARATVQKEDWTTRAAN